MPSLRVLGHAFRAWRRNLRSAKHEPETKYLYALLSGAPVCLHVGASDGRHSYVMTQVAPQAKIHAFEPSAFAFQVLKLTTAWHGITDRVFPVHSAVSDAAGELLLVTPRKTSGRMGRAYAFVAETEPTTDRARPDLEDVGVRTEATPVLTLDEYCASRRIERVDFVRMDIEGAEEKALRGAATLIDRDLPHLLIEIHPTMLESRFGTSGEAVVEMIRSRGYRMFALNGARLEERDGLVPGVAWKDYFFIHPARAASLPEGPFRQLMNP